VLLLERAALPRYKACGNAWGSFGSLARLATGMIASSGLMMWVLPTFERLLWLITPERTLGPE